MLREVLVITAALSLPDPRERPLEQQARPTSCTPVSARALGLPRRSGTSGSTSGPAARPELQRVPAAVQQRVPQLPPDPGVAGARVPAAAGAKQVACAHAAAGCRATEERGRHAGRGCARRGRHPPGSARRPALPHRASRTAKPSRTTAAQRKDAKDRPPAPVPACDRLPRRPQHPLQHLPGLDPGQAAARGRDGRRARRDLAALRPHQRRHRPALGRADRRAPGQARPTPSRTGRGAGRP